MKADKRMGRAGQPLIRCPSAAVIPRNHPPLSAWLHTLQAEGGAALIDKGSGDAAFDGLNVVAGQQALYWNGALRFVVGEKASAACYDANGNRVPPG